MNKSDSFLVKDAAIGLVVLVVVLSGALYGWQYAKVFSREMSGKAMLREAQWSRQIAVEEAKAKLESAKLHAESEVVRAEGVAKANSIIADGLGGAEGYLRYLWIESLKDSNGEVIHVPTEAGLPILEAGRKTK